MAVIITCFAQIIAFLFWLPSLVVISHEITMLIVHEPNLAVSVVIALVVAAPLYGAFMAIGSIILALLAFALALVEGN